jgi:hypothetical protein
MSELAEAMYTSKSSMTYQITQLEGRTGKPPLTALPNGPGEAIRGRVED